MAVKDTIQSIKNNVANAYTKLQGKGATIPTKKNIENLANTIDSISGGGGITPSGTLLIQTNGKYDVTSYAEADVQVEVPSTPVEPPVLTIKNITENGTYNAEDDGADGYASVTVNVSGGGEGITDGLARYVAGDDTLTQLTSNDFGNITELKAGAFFVNTSIKTPTVTKITLPSTVTKLGNNCFYGNTALQEINTDNIDTMGDYCFNGCAGLKHIDISKVAEKGRLPTYLLYNCTGIESIITGKYGSNPYIFPNSYSLYGLKNLKNINNGENILRIISGHSSYNLTQICYYMSYDLETPLIDVEDYATGWRTSGGGSKNGFYASKIKNYTFVNATEIKQGGAGYPEGLFTSTTIINVYMPKLKNLGNTYPLGSLTSVERVYLPVVTKILGTAISKNCKKVIIGDTSPTLSSAMTNNTGSIFYVPHTNIDYYVGATNWSTMFLNDGTEETRFAVYETFTSGDTLPTQIGTSQVYNVTWYEDEDFTTLASGTATETKEYYGKITAVV